MTEVNSTPETVEETPSLQVADLIVISNLFQAVAQRGAIRADEMELVGSVYTKLNKFLVASGAIPAPGANEGQTEEVTND